MCINGRCTDKKFFSDLMIGQSLGNKQQHLLFPDQVGAIDHWLVQQDLPCHHWLEGAAVRLRARAAGVAAHQGAGTKRQGVHRGAVA